MARRAGVVEVGLLCGSAVAIGAGALVKDIVAPAAPHVSESEAPVSSALTLPDGASAPPPAPPPAPTTHAGCDIEDRGVGDYVEVPARTPTGATADAISPVKLFASGDRIDASGAYTLVVHFHGGDAIRKILLPEKLGIVLATIDRGNGSRSYEGLFRTRGAWADLVASVDARVSDVAGHPARASSVIVTSWSAGYKAVEQALDVGADRGWSGLVLLDSLHAGYAPGTQVLHHGQLDPFIKAARRATTDPKFFFDIAHTEIIPPGYASTTETATFVLHELGVHPDDVNSGGVDALPVRSIAKKGRLDVRGYGGDDAAAHCDELRLLPGILRRELASRP